jgi:hypothetical protein
MDRRPRVYITHSEAPESAVQLLQKKYDCNGKKKTSILIFLMGIVENVKKISLLGGKIALLEQKINNGNKYIKKKMF